jgi:hypothetical protein
MYLLDSKTKNKNKSLKPVDNAKIEMLQARSYQACC